MSRKIFVPLLIFFSCCFFSVLPKSVSAAPCGGWYPNCNGTCSSGYCAPNKEGQCICQDIPCVANGVSCSNNSQCCSGYCHSDGKCSAKPSNPTNTPVPSCGKVGDSCGSNNPCCSGNTCWSGKCIGPCDCKLGHNYCINECTGDEGWANVSCWVSHACLTEGGAQCSGPTLMYVGTKWCPADAPPDPECHPIKCFEMAECSTRCDIGSFGGCGGGIGHCDNCCGVDCGTCSGGGATPVPTQTSCTSDCLNPAVSPCIATTCYNVTCLGNCNQWCYGTLSCAQTTLERFEIRRNDSTWSFTDGRTPGRDITDAQNRLHICDSYLSNESPNPRSLVYVAWLNNANGCNDIDDTSVKMRWLGNNTAIAMTKLTGYQAGPCAYTATVTYPTTTNIASAQGFEITMKSILGGVTLCSHRSPDRSSVGVGQVARFNLT